MARIIRAKNTSEEKAASALEFKAIKEIISLNSLPIIEMAGRSQFPATFPQDTSIDYISTIVAGSKQQLMAHNHLVNCCRAKPINRWKKHWNWNVLPMGFKYKREPSPLTVYIINDLKARKINSKLPFDLGKVFGYGLLCCPQEH